MLLSKGLNPLQDIKGMELSQEAVVFRPGSRLRKTVGLPGM